MPLQAVRGAVAGTWNLAVAALLSQVVLLSSFKSRYPPGSSYDLLVQAQSWVTSFSYGEFNLLLKTVARSNAIYICGAAVFSPFSLTYTENGLFSKDWRLWLFLFFFFFQLSQVNMWPFTFTEEFPLMSAQRISLGDSLWISFHVSWKWIMIGLERRKSSWVFRRWFPGFPKLAICHSIFTHAMGPVSVFQVELVSAWLKLICFKLKFLNFSNQKRLRWCKWLWNRTVTVIQKAYHS